MVTLDERQQISEFTVMSEGSKASFGFDWERDYGGTYRQCPTAFWLAPDAADILPEADLLHPRPTPAPPPQPDALKRPASEKVDNRAPGAAMSIILAGPIFTATIPLMSGFPTVAPIAAVATLTLAPLTIPIGMLLAVIPICVGSLMMGKLGEMAPHWRHPAAWMGVGAPFGMTLAALVGAGVQGVTAMAITGSLCAGIARWKVRWSKRVQSTRNTLTPAVAISA